MIQEANDHVASLSGTLSDDGWTVRLVNVLTELGCLPKIVVEMSKFALVVGDDIPKIKKSLKLII